MNDTFEDTKLITVSSSNGILYNGSYLSDVIFPFLGLLKDDTSIVFSHVDILSAQIPVSFYTIDATNNILNVSINGVKQIVTISVGNYIASTLVIELAAKLALLSSGIAVTFNNNNGKLSISTSGVTLSLIYSGSSAWRWLGLNHFSNSNVSISNLGTEFPFPLSLVGIKKLKICSAALSTESIDAYDYTTGFLLQIIPVNAPQFGMVNFESKYPVKTKLKARRIDGIDIQILDENNNYVNFNNVDWSLTIALTITRYIPPKSLQEFSDIVGNYKPNNEITSSDNIKHNGNLIYTIDNDLDFFLWENGIDI
jgi:hypothetical protein